MTFENIITKIWNLLSAIGDWAEEFWNWGFTETSASILGDTYTFQPFYFLLASGILLFLLIRILLSLNS